MINFDNKWDLLGTDEDIDRFTADLIKEFKVELSPMDSKDGCISFKFNLADILDGIDRVIECEGYYVNKFSNKHLSELQLGFKSTDYFVNEEIIHKVYDKYHLENMNTYYNYRRNMIGLIKLRHKFKVKKDSQVNREYIARKGIGNLYPTLRKQYYTENLAINGHRLDKSYTGEVFGYNYSIAVLNNRTI